MVWVYLCHIVSWAKCLLEPSLLPTVVTLLSQFTFLLPSSSRQGAGPTCAWDLGWGIFYRWEILSKGLYIINIIITIIIIIIIII